ncbi:uncharacterized protein ISCGN_027186 [Ixodes scapularis]
MGTQTSPDDLHLPSRSPSKPPRAAPVAPPPNRKVNAALPASAPEQEMSSPAQPAASTSRGRGLPPHTSAPQRKPGEVPKQSTSKGQLPATVDKPMDEGLPTLFVTGMVDCVVEIVACILLVKAASDDNRYLLIPWLVYNSLCIISHVVGAIHFFFVSVYVGLAGVIGGILVIILSVRIYIFVIVAVYYKLLLQSLPFVLQSDEEVELISHSGSPGLESNGSGASPDFGGSLVEFPGVSI